MADPAAAGGGPLDPSLPAQAPPWAPARLPPGRHGLPREFVAANQRGRAMTAALEVFTRRGYPDAPVAGVIRMAGISRTTFYAHFADKEACLLATFDSVVAWLEGRATDAARDADGWAGGAVAVIASLLDRLAEDPRLARLCAVEILAAGAPARGRHDALVDRLAAALRGGRALGSARPELAPVFEQLLVAGALSVVARAVVDGGHLADLRPELDGILLGPYLDGGTTAARRIAARPD